jgi:UDP-glucose 4-epimerase
MCNSLLVTGGAGFIGSHVTEELVDAGYEITVLDSFVTGSRENVSHLDIEVVEGDVREEATLSRVLPKMDGIFHLAAHIGNVKSIENPFTDAEVNAEGTLQLLESAREHDVTNFVYSSSAAIYGEVEYTPVDEVHPVDPDSPYGVTKLTGEKYAMCYGRLYDIAVVALRYFNVYGTNQYYDEYGNVIPIWTKRLLNDEPLIIYGDGKQTRDFVNVRDVAHANRLAYESDVEGEAYAIGTGKATRIGNLARLSLEISGRTVPINYEPPRDGEVRHSVADISKAERELGFDPTVPINEGLAEYLSWMETKA